MLTYLDIGLGSFPLEKRREHEINKIPPKFGPQHLKHPLSLYKGKDVGCRPFL